MEETKYFPEQEGIFKLYLPLPHKGAVVLMDDMPFPQAKQAKESKEKEGKEGEKEEGRS